MVILIALYSRVVYSLWIKEQESTTATQKVFSECPKMINERKFRRHHLDYSKRSEELRVLT